MKNNPNSLKWLAALIIFVQLFDVALHVMIDQVEDLRITANFLVIQFIIPAYMGWYKGYFRNSAYWLVGGYLLLNLIFLALHGLTNPEQEGAPRTMLFILVIVTVGFSILFVRRYPDQES